MTSATPSSPTSQELREQIDALILKFEGYDAEEDTLNTIMHVVEEYTAQQVKEARIDELRTIWLAHPVVNHVLEARSYCVPTTRINDRIAQLTQKEKADNE